MNPLHASITEVSPALHRYQHDEARLHRLQDDLAELHAELHSTPLKDQQVRELIYQDMNGVEESIAALRAKMNVYRIG